MFDRLIRESVAPARVRSAIDKLLGPEELFPTVDETLLRRLVRIAESSRFAIDILRAYPEAWEILESGQHIPAPHPPDAAALRRNLALSLFHILVVDLLDTVPCKDTYRLLSDIADHATQSAFEIARVELTKRYGVPPGEGQEHDELPGLAVLGMGKLGGRELNFSSDIDLIFLFRDDADIHGSTSGGERGRLSIPEWHTRMVERIVDILSARAHGPVGYRVDLRLRPEGNTGPLVRSLDSSVRYYESEGLTFERQALIKARVIAGDAALGARFLHAVEPFIYRRFLDREAIYQIEAIKSRIEAQARAHGRRHVKLSRGGIREIEFITQLFQLANGGRCDALRTPSTLVALDALVENHYMIESDRDELVTAYHFLRRIEHRLQMMDGRQTHLLPESMEELQDIALRLGFADGEAFWNEYLAVTDRVRDFYERRVHRSREISLTPVEERLLVLLDEEEDETVQAQAAEELGIELASLPELRRLAKSSHADPQTSAIRRHFIRSAANWLPALAAFPDPAQGLSRFSRIIETYGAKATLYEILGAYPAVTDLLVNIAALSQPLSDLLCRDPAHLEALLAPGGVTGQRDREALHARFAELARIAPSRARAAAAIATEERLRIGVRFLMGLADAMRTGRELAVLTELLLHEATRSVEGGERIGIIGMGRFGGGDMGFVSDLDLVLIADDSPGDKSGGESDTVLADRILKTLERFGIRVDLRLRPMGRTSPSITTAGSLERYIREEAEIWERIAWTRARIVGGSAPLRARLQGIIDEFLFAKPLGAAERETIRAMRTRLRKECASPRDLKRGEGAFIDAEFLAALVRIESRSASNDVIELLHDREDVRDAYLYLKALDTAAQIVTGRAWQPELSAGDQAAIALLMERLGENVSELEEKRRVLVGIGM
ncbi:MAG: hypothetical protein AAB229_10240 [Candidatus Hydrogenedentota bacterium]